MSFGNTSVDPGANPSVAIARDLVSSAIYQRVKLANPTENSVDPIGVDAYPMTVKPRRRGTSDYDSGRTAVTTTLTSVTTATVYIEKVIITNITDAQHWFTLTNTANAEWISRLGLSPRETRTIDLGFAAMVGLKVQSDADSAVVAVIVGAQ